MQPTRSRTLSRGETDSSENGRHQKRHHLPPEERMSGRLHRPGTRWTHISGELYMIVVESELCWRMLIGPSLSEPHAQIIIRPSVHYIIIYNIYYIFLRWISFRYFRGSMLLPKHRENFDHTRTSSIIGDQKLEASNNAVVGASMMIRRATAIYYLLAWCKFTLSWVGDCRFSGFGAIPWNIVPAKMSKYTVACHCGASLRNKRIFMGVVLARDSEDNLICTGQLQFKENLYVQEWAWF